MWKRSEQMKIQSGRHQGRALSEEVGGAVKYMHCAKNMY